MSMGTKSNSMAWHRRQVVAFGSDRRPHGCIRDDVAADLLSRFVGG